MIEENGRDESGVRSELVLGKGEERIGEKRSKLRTEAPHGKEDGEGGEVKRVAQRFNLQFKDKREEKREKE